MADALLTDRTEIARRTVDAVREIMYDDNACDRIVPSDLRVLIGEIERLRATIIDLHNTKRHEFSAAVEAAADKLFADCSHIATDPFAKFKKT